MAQLTGDGGMVLVVDDSDDIRRLICTQLRLLGYEVAEARDGWEAFKVAKRTHPSLIIMDIQMPVMDGLAATRLLRDIEELSDTAIVAFSAYGSSGINRQQALEAGCSDYVSKVKGINQLPTIAQRFLSTY